MADTIVFSWWIVVKHFVRFFSMFWTIWTRNQCKTITASYLFVLGIMTFNVRHLFYVINERVCRLVACNRGLVHSLVHKLNRSKLAAVSGVTSYAKWLSRNKLTNVCTLFVITSTSSSSSSSHLKQFERCSTVRNCINWCCLCSPTNITSHRVVHDNSYRNRTKFIAKRDCHMTSNHRTQRELYAIQQWYNVQLTSVGRIGRERERERERGMSIWSRH